MECTCIIERVLSNKERETIIACLKDVERDTENISKLLLLRDNSSSNNCRHHIGWGYEDYCCNQEKIDEFLEKI